MLETQVGADYVIGSIKLYTIKGKKANCKFAAKYESAYDYSTGKYIRRSTVNGKSKSYSGLIKRQKSFSLSYLKRTRNSYNPSGYYYTSTAKSLSK